MAFDIGTARTRSYKGDGMKVSSDAIDDEDDDEGDDGEGGWWWQSKSDGM